MKRKYQRRVIDDWPADLAPILETRKCAVCGYWTWWASPRQRTKGMHWACIPGSVLWEVTPEHHARVLLAILAEFPGATVSRVENKPTPVGYAGPDAGPCAGCGGSIRRYGERAAGTLCAGCVERRST